MEWVVSVLLTGDIRRHTGSWKVSKEKRLGRGRVYGLALIWNALPVQWIGQDHPLFITIHIRTMNVLLVAFRVTTHVSGSCEDGVGFDPAPCQGRVLHSWRVVPGTASGQTPQTWVHPNEETRLTLHGYPFVVSV